MYDIVTHEITRADRLTMAEATSHAGARSKSRREEITKEKADAMEARRELEEKRRMARVSFKRWEREVDRGYNPITTLQEVAVHPHVSRPVTTWARLQRDGIADFDMHETMLPSSAPMGQSKKNLAGSPVRAVPEDAGASSGRISNRGNVFSARPAAESSSSGRAATALTSSRPTETNLSSSARLLMSKSGCEIPRLDLTLAQPPSPVTYVEPLSGAAGKPVPIIRTGGFR